MIENLHETEILGERRERILTTLTADGFVTIDELAKSFGCSAQTVRRDLIALEAAGLVKRFHGGAGLPGLAARPSYGEKREAHPSDKRAIAAAAVRLMARGDVVYLDTGTTLEAVAQELAEAAEAGRLADVRVVCGSINAASVLAGKPGLRVEILPGEIHTPDGAITGEAAAALGGLRLDHAFIGVSAFDATGAPWDFDPAKIAVKQAALAAAHNGWVLADASKFTRTARRRICRAADLTGLITNQRPPAALTDALDAAGCSIVLG
ncbi:DeoR/GlpR family DNA-binding transcription regulator [Acuticoccus kandeliae]|uniref:DeoR/GlpR family DNA-binding transcription regulator n=1 Tax=Acuticoccus kandeliae TaxID=2073160 RepID=UPI000D3E41D1|nr:DeoR/GlpR family DNA-binding transcription regulator [Acuticoccus kandeliae]